MELNSRELAILCWLAIFLAAILLVKSMRPVLFAVIRAAFHRKIVDIVGVAALYTSGCVWMLQRVGLWDWRNLKTAILWFITTAFVTMANTRALQKGPAMFGSLLREAVAITAIVVFIGGINTFPFLAEFILVPFVTFIAAIAAAAEHRAEHRIVLAPLNGILTFTGLYIIGYSIYRIVIDWQKLDPTFQAREFTIPILLTVMFLPFLYGLMIYIGFENAAIRLHFKMEDRGLRRSVWWRGILAFGLSPQSFSRFIHDIQFSNVSDPAGVAKVVATLRRARARERSRKPVNWNEGWPPYDAADFLKAHGLGTGVYQPFLVNWAADSPYLKLNADVVPDHLVYRIEGTETAATELELELDVRIGPSPGGSDERFWSVAVALVTEALGDETAGRFKQKIPTDTEVFLQAGTLTIRVSRDDWSLGTSSGYSRKLVVRHSAYKDPFAELS